MIGPSGRALAALRGVEAATLVALLWKFTFFVGVTKVYADMPLHYRMFPEFFEAATTFSISYAVAVVGLGIALLTGRAVVRHVATWAVLAAVSVLCVHLGGYNDATFTTAWWATIWAVWFSGRSDDADQLLWRGAQLSRAIVSVVFLGGAVGKWTSEYWSGQVLYEIYFTSRDFWMFNLLRDIWDPGALRGVATWYSRGVILIESVAGLLLWVLPARVAATIGVALSLSVAILSNFYLISVVLSLAGLASVGFWARTAPRRAHHA